MCFGISLVLFLSIRVECPALDDAPLREATVTILTVASPTEVMVVLADRAP